MESQTVSIIMAVYNGEKYLAEAIESVLNQTDSNFELIIVDDGSTDQTAQTIQKYLSQKVYSFWQPNQGQAAALNYGLKFAHHPYISFLDADDIYISTKLASQKAILHSNPEIDLVTGYMEEFISPELPDYIKSKRNCSSIPVSGYLPSLFMCRKSCFEKIGLFNPKLRLGACVDWWMRAKEQGIKGYMMLDIILRRRIHNHNQGILCQQHRSDYLQVVKDSLKRRKLLAS